MPRRNQGPRLQFLDRRGCYYIVWTELGRSRQRSTGTADRQVAEIALSEFLRRRIRSSGPRDPTEILVTDVLSDYAEERGPQTVSGWRIGYAIDGLAKHWEGRAVAEVTRQTCEAYVKRRGRSAGTARRELGVLRAAINHSHHEGRITRPVAVHLPDRPEPKDRWLTRDEAAALLRASRRERRVRLHLPLFVLMGLYTGQRKEAIYLCAGHRWTLSANALISTRQAENVPISNALTYQFLVVFCHTSKGRDFEGLILALLSITTVPGSET